MPAPAQRTACNGAAYLCWSRATFVVVVVATLSACPAVPSGFERSQNAPIHYTIRCGDFVAAHFCARLQPQLTELYISLWLRRANFRLPIIFVNHLNGNRTHSERTLVRDRVQPRAVNECTHTANSLNYAPFRIMSVWLPKSLRRVPQNTTACPRARAHEHPCGGLIFTAA